VAKACLLGTTALLAALLLTVTQRPLAGDVAVYATADRPLVRLRGRLVADPERRRSATPELHSQSNDPLVTLLVEAHWLDQPPEWLPVRGLVRVYVPSATDAPWQVGEGLEILGRLSPPTGPRNPGEADQRQVLFDQGIFAVLVTKSPAAISAWPAGAESWSLRVWLARTRSAARSALSAQVRGESLGVAQALLLGDLSAMDPALFEAYQRTGVYHVLAISGQHLVLLAAGLSAVLRLFSWPPRQQALAVMVVIVLYALLTGARPPVLRAAVMVVAFGLAAVALRRANPPNNLALALLFIFVLQPAAIFQPGTQLSFLAVLVLQQGVAPLTLGRPDPSPLMQLEQRMQSLSRQLLAAVARLLLRSIAATLFVWLTLAPLLASQFHLVSPVAVMFGPPLVLLVAIALVGGFIFLPVAMLSHTLATPAGWLVEFPLRLAGRFLAWAEACPGGWWYVAGPTSAQTIVFYLLLVAILTVIRPDFRLRLFGLLFGGWLCWTLGMPSSLPADVKVAVLAVGHGNATVVETPAGEVFLFDAGSLSGPEVATRVIAPFLWNRGHTHINEIFLSHADMDHFNGVPALLERFRVGQVSLNPTFADKSNRGVRFLLARLETHGVATRVLSRGTVLAAGDMVIEVLHPPIDGPPGTENARSLVLGLSHGRNRLLLTGDVEPPGLAMMLQQPPWRADVLVAPHHGSVVSNTPELAAWVQAGLVVISDQEPTRHRPEPYRPLGATVWQTYADGAALLTSRETGWEATTFVTRLIWRSAAKPKR
jgi:competence protein ComEC